MSMSDKKILEAIQGTVNFAKGHRPDVPVSRYPSDNMAANEWDVVSHVQWMGMACEAMLAVGEREKLMRWLGFMQGALWAGGIASITDFRMLNQSDEKKTAPLTKEQALVALREILDDLKTTGVIPGIENAMAVKLDGRAVGRVETFVVGTSDKYPVRDWRYEVANGDTVLGYQEWLSNKIEQEGE